jgi:hypothetical protein
MPVYSPLVGGAKPLASSLGGKFAARCLVLYPAHGPFLNWL